MLLNPLSIELICCRLASKVFHRHNSKAALANTVTCLWSSSCPVGRGAEMNMLGS